MIDTLYAALAADPLVRGVWLGGSRARGEDDAYSDVDLVFDAPGWEPARLGGLWLGGQAMKLAGDPFFHGILADGTILDVRLGEPWEGYVPVHLPHPRPLPQDEPPGGGEFSADGPALDFWLNSMKHAKPLARGVGGMLVFGLHHDAMALIRLWVLEDTGKDPGPGAFTIFGLTPLTKDHLTPDRLRLLGLPKRDEAELRAAVRALRDAATATGEAAEKRWGVPYPHRLDAVVRERWPV